MSSNPAIIQRVATKKISGTKSSLQNSQLLISSGVPSLDHVIGGGIPIGSIFLIEEDVYGKFSNVLFKYYLSEGILSNHEIFLATLDNDSKKLVSDLPSPTNAESEVLPSYDTTEKMKIAWRYNNLTPVQSSMDSSLQFGHHYDISKPLEPDVVNNAPITHWIHSKKEDPYESLLRLIKEKISNVYIRRENVANENILRIGIQSLGSPYWEVPGGTSQDSTRTLLKFLYGLRAIVRSTYVVVLLTIPCHLFQNPEFTLNVRHSVDGCIKLDSFAGTDKENYSALKDYHGLFYMPKLISMNTLAPYVPPTLDLAFKMRRKKFLIEKLHLPPELQESSEREQDDGSSFGCGSIKQKNLDF